MTDSYTSRPIKIVSLPIPEEYPFKFGLSTVLKFSSGKHLDIGCIVFLKRKFSKSITQQVTSCTVDLMSFSEERTEIVQSLTFFFNDEICRKQRKPLTIYQWAVSFRNFMNWCDENNQIIKNLVRIDFEKAFRNYIMHLRQIALVKSLSLRAQVKSQNNVITVLNNLFEVENFARGMNLLKSSFIDNNPTVVPAEDVQTKALSWLSKLFHGLTAFVLNNSPYPHKLSVPEYLGWPNNYMWIVPSNFWYITPDEECTTPYHTLLSHEKIATKIEMINMRVKHGKTIDDNAVIKDIYRLKARINKANIDERDVQRINRALCANSAFIELFVAETGMSSSLIRDLPWTSELKESLDNPSILRQRFRVIKYRAAGRIVNFEIGAAFLNEFRKFMKLREYLLNGKVCDTLFFTYSCRTHWEIEKFKSNRIYSTIKNLDKNIKPVTHREWRASKQDWAIRNTVPSIAAKLLQHSEITAIRSYSNGSQISHESEFSEFFSNFEAIIQENRNSIDFEKDTFYGSCIAPDQPAPIKSGLKITPECGRLEGCLFCDKYRVHADETDIRKLLSCRLYVIEVSSFASSTEEYSEVITPIIKRIDYILSEIEKKSPDEYGRLKSEVETYGELTFYWRSKLEMLQELYLL
ncbi:hypothetical protein H9T43_002181 [Salmonella enterica]|nr:hypothetical protein [Salmonella enterica]